MKQYQLYTPEGVRDYIGENALRKYQIESKLIQLFLESGYALVETPTFEYLDVFVTGQETYHTEEIYKWMNRQGEIVALRSDMTKAIARIVATQKLEHFPVKYTYRANSFRYSKRYQGKCHEFTQTGVECIGEKSASIDLELIELAIKGLVEIGITDFTIHLGSAAFWEAILEESGLIEAQKQMIDEAIYEKDAVRIREILCLGETPHVALDLLIKSIGRVGDIPLIEKIKEALTSVQAKKALDELLELYNQLTVSGVEQYVVLDLNILSYAKYYTGIMFQGFTYGVGESIVEGGRYDKLMGEFGKDLPAIGFAMNSHLLLQKVNQLAEI